MNIGKFSIKIKMNCHSLYKSVREKSYELEISGPETSYLMIEKVEDTIICHIAYADYYLYIKSTKNNRNFVNVKTVLICQEIILTKINVLFL